MRHCSVLMVQGKESMKRNTTIALAYWLVLFVVLLAAGGIRETAESVSIALVALGLTYLVLAWSPFLIVKFIERRPIASLGLCLNSPLRIALWGVGAFILISTFSILETWYRVSFLQEALASAAPIPSNWLMEIALQLLLVGLPEEIYNRGYLLTRLRESWGTWPALLISSLLFGVMHLGMGDLTRAIQAGLSGLVFGWAFLATESVYAPALTHILGNLFGTTVVRVVLSL